MTTFAEVVRDLGAVLNGVEEAGIAAGIDIVRSDEYKLITDLTAPAGQRAIVAAALHLPVPRPAATSGPFTWQQDSTQFSSRGASRSP